MKKKLLVLFALTTWLSVSVSAQSLRVYIVDKNGPYTNIRNAPKGKIVDKIIRGKYIKNPTGRLLAPAMALAM